MARQKLLPKFQHIWIDLYRINIYWIRCSFDGYRQRARLEFGVEPSIRPKADARFRVYEKMGEDIVVIWLSEKADNAAVAHECVHVVHWILSDRGMQLTDASEEAYAYLVEYIMRKIV